MTRLADVNARALEREEILRRAGVRVRPLKEAPASLPSGPRKLGTDVGDVPPGDAGASSSGTAA